MTIKQNDRYHTIYKVKECDNVVRKSAWLDNATKVTLNMVI